MAHMHEGRLAIIIPYLSLPTYPSWDHLLNENFLKFELNNTEETKLNLDV